MTRSETAPAATPLTFRALTVDGKSGILSGVDADGHSYPFFVFTPLREACLGRYEIPKAPSWPEYDVDFVLKYVPVPSDIPGPYPDGVTLGINERTGDLQRPWPQATYHGWPLYYVDGLHERVELGPYPVMFGPVTLDIETVDPNAGVRVRLPGPSVGP